MGHIVEPAGIDFLIKSPPLTSKERKELSEFIKKLKTKRKPVRKSKAKARKKTNA